MVLIDSTPELCSARCLPMCGVGAVTGTFTDEGGQPVVGHPVGLTALSAAAFRRHAVVLSDSRE